MVALTESMAVCDQLDGVGFGGDSHLVGEEQYETLSALPDRSNPRTQQARALRNSAIYRLSRREHSSFELRAKFKERFPELDDDQLVSEVLERLQCDGMQSDQRFTEAYTRMRCRKGMGPQRVAQELRERGVSSHMIDAELVSPEHDWYAAAYQTREKKFGDLLPCDFKIRMKQQAFLRYRGFTMEQIQSAFEPV